MAKSYGALAVVDVTLVRISLAAVVRNRDNEAECGCEGEREQRSGQVAVHYEYALK